MDTHHLKTSATPPVALHLFDGSSNSIISKITNLPIIFSTSDCMNLDFYVTLLNSSWTFLCNHRTLWFLYLHLRPPCLTPDDLTSLSLVLQYTCIHQNFWALTISNSVFVLQTFRRTPQNLQKLLISPMSLLSITNLLMFLARQKLKLSLLIILMTSKSI